MNDPRRDAAISSSFRSGPRRCSESHQQREPSTEPSAGRGPHPRSRGLGREGTSGPSHPAAVLPSRSGAAARGRATSPPGPTAQLRVAAFPGHGRRHRPGLRRNRPGHCPRRWPGDLLEPVAGCLHITAAPAARGGWTHLHRRQRLDGAHPRPTSTRWNRLRQGPSSRPSHPSLHPALPGHRSESSGSRRGVLDGPADLGHTAQPLPVGRWLGPWGFTVARCTRQAMFWDAGWIGAVRGPVSRVAPARRVGLGQPQSQHGLHHATDPAGPATAPGHRGGSFPARRPAHLRVGQGTHAQPGRSVLGQHRPGWEHRPHLLELQPRGADRCGGPGLADHRVCGAPTSPRRDHRGVPGVFSSRGAGRAVRRAADLLQRHLPQEPAAGLDDHSR